MQKMKETQDSLHRVAVLQDSIGAAMVDSISTVTKIDSAQLEEKFGSFATAVTGTNETVRLENELFTVDFATKGGKISAALKKYSSPLG
jgi:hypothetical protein